MSRIESLYTDKFQGTHKVSSVQFLHDWRFYYLFFIINISGNLGFDMLFDSRHTVIFAFIVTVLALYIERESNILRYLGFIAIYTLILLVPGFYLGKSFSFSSLFNIILKISTGILAIAVLKDTFIDYFLKIIVVFAVLSLICFGMNCMGIVIPYIPVDSTLIDGGNIFRVSSFVYTQLYNLSPGGGLTLRNCGPFWEPGAYQGFLNLAISFIIFGVPHLNKKYFIVLLILGITVITTYSTGGYIVLFYYIFVMVLISREIHPNTKFLILISWILIALYVYMSLDFLSTKVSTDTGRVGVSFSDLGEGVYFLFGYSYSADAFSNSLLKSASALLNLLRYSGSVGLIVYVGTLILGKQINLQRILWSIGILLILMNEPFLTTGPFWWSLLFIWNLIEVKRSNNEKYMFLEYYQ